MELNTQPILCCLGDSVAGAPTQFVMERCLAAQGLDWRAFTVEIAAEDFDTVLSGIQAMKFQALRFFPSFQPAAAALLVPDDPWADFIGAITSAGWTPAGWRGWHHWGLAIGEALASQLAWSDTHCWLHGDSLRCRSAAVAMHETPPAALLWTEAPDELPEQLSTPTGEDNWLTTLDWPAAMDRLVDATDAPIAFVSENPPESVLHADTPDAGEQFSELLNSRTSRCVVPESAQQSLRPWIDPGRFLPESDWDALSDAYDFQRWTGQPADLPLIRDALDEYGDF